MVYALNGENGMCVGTRGRTQQVKIRMTIQTVKEKDVVSRVIFAVVEEIPNVLLNKNVVRTAHQQRRNI